MIFLALKEANKRSKISKTDSSQTERDSQTKNVTPLLDNWSWKAMTTGGQNATINSSTAAKELSE